MAAHTTGTDFSVALGASPVEEIDASDSTGLHRLDFAPAPLGSPPALTNLVLIGDTLTWEHNGTPRSAQLQP